MTEPESPVEFTVSQLEEASSSNVSSTTENRRQLLDSKLKNYKEKLKRNLPVDAQLLACAQEELTIK